MLIAAAAILVVERSIKDDDSSSSKLTSSSDGSVGGVTSASSTTVSLFAFNHKVLNEKKTRLSFGRPRWLHRGTLGGLFDIVGTKRGCPRNIFFSPLVPTIYIAQSTKIGRIRL